MYTLNNPWKIIISIQNGVKAVINGTKKKRSKNEVKSLLYNDLDEHPEHYNMVDPKKAEKYATPIIYSLMARTWRPKPPKHKYQYCRSSSGGKWRHLFHTSIRRSHCSSYSNASMYAGIYKGYASALLW